MDHLPIPQFLQEAEKNLGHSLSEKETQDSQVSEFMGTKEPQQHNKS